MKRFMLLHFGFEKPTEAIMAAWKRWFASVADRSVEHGGFMGGRELSADGTRELAWDADAITGYSIIRAGSIEEAQKIAAENPFVKSIRVYEIRAHE